MDASHISLLDNVLIVLSILLALILLYLFFLSQTDKKAAANSRKAKNGRHNHHDLSETTQIPEDESHTTETHKNLPYTTREPFEETPGVTVDDFYNFKGARVLVVEDNKINQRIILSILQKSGILVTVANNGEEALIKLYNPDKEFDIVLMDISMPVMDGYICTEKIRANHRFDTLPIITFTAFAMGKEIDRMYELGANAHITKPLNSSQLYTAFEIYLGNINRPVSTMSALKMKGLDVQSGIAFFEGNEEIYNKKLTEFIFTYAGLVKQMPKWIDEKDYDQIRFNIAKMGTKLHSLGAYELDDTVTRMKKFFIYGTEHRLEEYKEIFPERLNRLIIAMRLYLQGELL